MRWLLCDAGAGSAPPSIADANVISGSSALAGGHRPGLTGRGPALADVFVISGSWALADGRRPWLPGAGRRSRGGSAGWPPDCRRFRAGLPPDCGRIATGFRAGRPPGLQTGPPPDCGRPDSEPGHRRIATAGIPNRAAAGIPGRAAAGIRDGLPPDSRLGCRRIRDWADRIRPGCRRAPARPALPQAEHAVDLRRRSVSAGRRRRAEVTRSNNPTKPYTGQIMITSPKDSRIYVRAAGQPC